MARNRCGEVVYSLWTNVKMEAVISSNSLLTTYQIRTTDTNAAERNSSLVCYTE